MIRLGVTVVLLLTLRLASQVKGQDSNKGEGANCQDMKNGFRINYQCELKCFEYAFKMKYTGDFCSGKPQLRIIEQDKFTASDVDKAIRCLSAMCKLKVPSSVCDDENPTPTVPPESTTNFIEDYDDCDDSNAIDSDAPSEDSNNPALDAVPPNSDKDDSSNQFSDDVQSNSDGTAENVPRSNSDLETEAEKVPSSNFVQSSDSNSTSETEYIPASNSDSVQQAKNMDSKADSFNSNSADSVDDYSVVTVFEDVFVDDDDETDERGNNNVEMGESLSDDATTQGSIPSSETLSTAESYGEVTKPDENTNFALTTSADLKEAVPDEVNGADSDDTTMTKTASEDDNGSSPAPTLIRSRRSLPPVEDYPNGEMNSSDDCEEEDVDKGDNEIWDSENEGKFDDCDDIFNKDDVDGGSSTAAITEEDVKNNEAYDTATTSADLNLDSTINDNDSTEASQNIEGENVGTIIEESSDDFDVSSSDVINVSDFVTPTSEPISDQITKDNAEIITEATTTVDETIDVKTETVPQIDTNTVTEPYLLENKFLDVSSTTLEVNNLKSIDEISFSTTSTISEIPSPVTDTDKTTNNNNIEASVITSSNEFAINDQSATTPISEFQDDLVAAASDFDQNISYQNAPNQFEDCNEDENSVDAIDDNLQDCDDDDGEDNISFDKGNDYTSELDLTASPSSPDFSTPSWDITTQNYVSSTLNPDLTTPDPVTLIEDLSTSGLDVSVSNSDFSTLSNLEVSTNLVTDTDIVVIPTIHPTVDVDSNSVGLTSSGVTIDESLSKSTSTDAYNSGISDTVPFSGSDNLISSNFTEISSSDSNKVVSEVSPIDSSTTLFSNEEITTNAPNDDEDCADNNDESDDYYNDYLAETDENTYDYYDDDDPHPVNNIHSESEYKSNSKTKIKNRHRQTGISDDTSIENYDQNYNSYDADLSEEYKNKNPSQTNSNNNYQVIDKYQQYQQFSNRENQYDGSYDYIANQREYSKPNQVSYFNSNGASNINPSADYNMKQQNVPNSNNLPKKFAMDFGKDKLLVNGNTVNWFKENNFMKSYSM